MMRLLHGILSARREGQIILSVKGSRVNNKIKLIRETILPIPVDLRGGGVN
jgi:hypothetical protein